MRNDGIRNRHSYAALLPALLLMVLLVLVPCREARAAQKASIFLKEEKLTMVQCERHRLTLSGASSKKVSWSSSDNSVATVDQTGLVTGVKKGKCYVTALYQNKKYKCAVSIKALTLSRSSLTLVRGRQSVLKLSSKNAGKAAWRSTDKKVATVDAGCVQALARGKCEIQVKWRGVVLSCSLTVVGLSQENLEKLYPVGEKNSGKVLLAGSSSLDLWYSAPQAFSPFEVVNMAISGSTTVQWLEWYEKMVVAYKPSAVVLYVGANDLGNGKSKSAEENAANTITLIRKIRSRLPDVPIYYVGICPCHARPKAWPLIKISNHLVKQFCMLKKDIYYLDVASAACLPDGTPNPDYFKPDRLHPNDAGYLIWKRVVAGAVRKELNLRSIRGRLEKVRKSLL